MIILAIEGTRDGLAIHVADTNTGATERVHTRDHAQTIIYLDYILNAWLKLYLKDPFAHEPPELAEPADPQHR